MTINVSRTIAAIILLIGIACTFCKGLDWQITALETVLVSGLILTWDEIRDVKKNINKLANEHVSE